MKTRIIYKIFFVIALGLVLLIVPNLLLETPFFNLKKPNATVLIKSIFGFVTVVMLLYVKRKYYDKNYPKYIGLSTLSKNLYNFCFGLSLIVFPLTITIVLSDTFQWAEMSYNLDNIFTPAYLIALLSTLLLEAIPEELIFRGYLYSNLNTVYNRIKSSLITIGLFVIIPPISALLSNLIFKSDLLDMTSLLNPSYIVWLLIFGTFVQYLRVITNNIWAGIGFHLVFVYMNKIVGQSADHVIQISNITNEPAYQITMGICLFITMLVLVLYPRLMHRKIKWKEVDK